jgi:hypothetical protein
MDGRTPLLSPGTTTRFIFLVVAVVLLFVAGVTVAWRRTGGKARWAAFGAAIAVIAWLAASAWTLLGGTVDLGAWTARLVFAFAAPIACAVALGASPIGALLAAGVPVAALVAAQAFRLPLEIMLHRPFRFGQTPDWLTVAGWKPDLLTGASAVVLLALVPLGFASRRVVRVWNLVAALLLADLVLVVWLNEWVGQSEFVWLPTVLIPFAALAHIVLFRKLRTEGGAEADARDRDVDATNAEAT